MCLEIKRLKTKRLVLREWQMYDLDDLFEFAKVPGVGEAAGWSHHKTIDESNTFLKMLIDFKTVYAIEMEGKVIGSFDFAWDDEKPDYISIGYSLSKDYWGQGIMTEAAIAIMDYLSENYDIAGFIAKTFKDNFNSQKLLARLGFVFVGVDGDDYIFALMLDVYDDE